MGHWLVGVAAAVAGVSVAANVGLILSALPAVLGKGAPYMPTRKRSLGIVFDQALPKLLSGERSLGRIPVVYDIGSGDGRVVIAAARRGYNALGFEINPLLVAVSTIWSTCDRFVYKRLADGDAPKRGWPEAAKATFYVRNLWSLDLSRADVIFCYGLTPIMDRLGDKITKENPNFLVGSNVFQLPHSKFERLFSQDEVFIYKPRSCSANPRKSLTETVRKTSHV